MTSRLGLGQPALLGVNIDHIATLRQLRGTPYPDLLEALALVEKAGAHQVTIHLREDRRHIQDRDVLAIRQAAKIAVNLEMAATEAMAKIACKVKPDWACLVPEKRQEVTTEGGLALKKNLKRVKKVTAQLQKKGIKVSLFIEPSLESIKLSHEIGADAVELHTGKYCILTQKGLKGEKAAAKELKRIEAAARLARSLGLRAHAGHGFDFDNVRPVAALEYLTPTGDTLPLIEEFNIGHAIVCRAALVGLERAVREMNAAVGAP